MLRNVENPAVTQFLRVWFAFAVLIPLSVRGQEKSQVWIADYTPPLYRKVALTGVSKTDPMPQNRPRTDSEPEETYVDAMTLQLTNGTTDVFIPIMESGLALTVRRNVHGEAWIPDRGLSPGQRPDLPFGSCWSSGLAANVHITERGGDAPVRVSVTDEEGTIHDFVAASAPPGERRYIPLPTTRSEQDWAQMRLTADRSGVFVLRRKFGSVLVFRKDPNVSITVRNGDVQECHTFLRLDSVSDRFGSKVSYIFGDRNMGLVPDEITYRTRRVRIERNQSGYVERVTDPNSGDRRYEYRPAGQPGGAPLLIAQKQQVTGPVRATTSYDYEEMVEGNSEHPTAIHCNISRISDPRKKAYEFQYAFDPIPLGPVATRCLRAVKLPDEIGVCRFFNESRVISPNGELRRMSFVSDAEGNGRLYEFAESRDVAITVGDGAIALAQFAVHRRQTVSYFSGSEHEFSQSDQRVHPIGKTKLIAVEGYEFDPEAGMALRKTTDPSGNATEFICGDTLSREWLGPGVSDPLSVRCSDVTAFIDPMGAKTLFTYEPLFRLLGQTTDPAGRISMKVMEGPFAALVSERLYANAQTMKLGQPFSQKDYQYTDKEFPGFVTRTTIRKTSASPENLPWEHDLVTDFKSDSCGNCARETADPDGVKETTSYAWDEVGNKRSVTYSGGYRVEFKYDAVNHLTRIIRPGSNGDRAVKRLQYDPRGNKTMEVEPQGAVHQIEYDGTNRMVREIWFPAGGFPDKPRRTVDYRVNAVGSRTQDVGSDGKRRLVELDAMRRPVKFTQIDGSSSALEYGKNSGSDLFDSSQFAATSVTESGGQKTEMTFDANSRRTAVAQSYGADLQRLKRWTLRYDGAGNLILEIGPDGGKTTHEYDAMNRLIRTDFPNGKTERTLFTSTGLQYATIDASGARKERKFDSTGEPIEEKK